MKIEFESDKLTGTGPSVDGGYKLSFYLGEYQQLEYIKAMAIPQKTPLKVTIEVEE